MVSAQFTPNKVILNNLKENLKVDLSIQRFKNHAVNIFNVM